MAAAVPGVGGGTGLLFQVAVGAVLVGLFSSPSQASGGSLGGIQPWVFVMVYAGFAALVVAQRPCLGASSSCIDRERHHG
jgi:hypothetical protein